MNSRTSLIWKPNNYIRRDYSDVHYTAYALRVDYGLLSGDRATMHISCWSSSTNQQRPTRDVLSFHGRYLSLKHRQRDQPVCRSTHFTTHALYMGDRPGGTEGLPRLHDCHGPQPSPRDPRLLVDRSYAPQRNPDNPRQIRGNLPELALC